MIKLVIWDYTGESSAWLKNFLKPNVAEIVRTLRPDDPDQAEVILRGDWDYVLIFTTDDTRKVFDEMLSTMRSMNVPTDNIIFVSKFKDWLKNPAAIYSLLNPSAPEVQTIYRWFNFVNHRQWHYYNSCDAEGLHYVGTSRDEYIISSMYIEGKNHAADAMKTFHALTKKFYGTDDDDGYFLDLGANIGTTGIYFLNKLVPRLKLFAVEPDAENFKLLRVNLILNDLDNRAMLVNCGLGENFDTLTLHRNLNNPGGNGVILIDDLINAPTETVQIAPLDYLLAESGIAPEDVKYIWIDTEGFEAQVLLGAQNLLANSFAPVFMECNLLAWKKSGLLEKLVDMLAGFGYGRYIWIQEFLETHEEKIYPIENLLTVVNYAPLPLGQIGDIF